MKKLISLVVALSALLPATTALAADYDTLPPPPPPPPLRAAAYDWTGGYVGGYIGMACVDGILHDNTGGGDFLNAGCGGKIGALGGYNIQMDEIVFGAEANIETTSNLVYNPQVGAPTADFKYRYDYIARLNGRIGWAMDDTLIFLQGGGAYAMSRLTDNVSTAPADHLSGKWGVSIGGGIEQAVTDSFRLRFDYLFTHFFDSHYGCTAVCSIDGHENEHEVRAAAIWAF